MAKIHLDSHTGLRGIAALMVAPVHMYCDKFVNGFEACVLPFLNSALAVDVFFILSGFILPYVYHTYDGKMNSRWKKFFVARLARIYPLHLLTIAIIGIMILVANSRGISMVRPYFLSDLPPQLMLVHTFPFIEKWGWNHPSWSISMEFLAYITLFPFLTLVFSGKSPLFIKILFIIIFCGIYTATYGLCHKFAANAAMGWYAIGRVVSGFTIGFLLCKINDQHREISQKIQNRCDIIFITFIIAYIASCFKWFNFQWLILIVPFLILGISSNNLSFTLRILGNPITIWLGTISYSIYMIHTIFGKIVIGLAQKMPSPSSPMIGSALLAGMFGILLLISSLSYYLFENPTRKWITKYEQKRQIASA